MATVGNLFLNIGGSAKGLQKAVKSAKSSMNDYGRSSRRSVEHEKARLRNRQADVKKFQSQQQQSNSFLLARGIEPPAGASQQLARLQGREKSQHRKVRRAEHAEMRDKLSKSDARSRSRTRMQIGMVASILGVSLAGLGGLARLAISSGVEGKKALQKFQYMGPQGSQIIREEIGMMLDAMKAAADPTMSSALLKNVKLRRTKQQASMEPGGTAQLMISIEDVLSNLTIGVNAMLRFLQNLPGVTSMMRERGGGFTDSMIAKEALDARFGKGGYQY